MTGVSGVSVSIVGTSEFILLIGRMGFPMKAQIIKGDVDLIAGQPFLKKYEADISVRKNTLALKENKDIDV